MVRRIVEFASLALDNSLRPRAIYSRRWMNVLIVVAWRLVWQQAFAVLKDVARGDAARLNALDRITYIYVPLPDHLSVGNNRYIPQDCGGGPGTSASSGT